MNDIVNQSALIIPELNGAKIRKTEDGRFSVYDLIRVSGEKKGQREVWKRLCKAHPECVGWVEKEKLGTGRAKKTTPVATTENCKLILDLLLGSRPSPKNQQILSMLKSVFWMLNPESEFYVKGKKQVYRVDLFLHSANVAIECDEDGHRHYDKKKERKRQAEIENVLGCVFVRFDPYSSNYDDLLLLERVANAARIADLSRYMLIQEIAFVDVVKGEEFASDRYRGLYRKTTNQLRDEAGLKKSETPLNAMSSRDLTMNSLVNQLVAESGDPNLAFEFGDNIRQGFERTMKKPLNPVWEINQVRPSQARKVLLTGQMELPY